LQGFERRRYALAHRTPVLGLRRRARRWWFRARYVGRRRGFRRTGCGATCRERHERREPEYRSDSAPPAHTRSVARQRGHGTLARRAGAVAAQLPDL
jgi:hypothetical protein